MSKKSQSEIMVNPTRFVVVNTVFIEVPADWGSIVRIVYGDAASECGSPHEDPCHMGVA